MSNKSILDYVDSIMSKIDVPDNQKIQIENELIRYIMDNAENTSIDEVKTSLSFPEEFAASISKKLAEYNIDTRRNEYSEAELDIYHGRRHHQKYVGEFMKELNNVNLKLLYIPLIQISSGMTRLVMPLTEDDDDYY